MEVGRPSSADQGCSPASPTGHSTWSRQGFGSATAFREHFQRFVTTSPQAYRRAFRSAPPASH
ncbi:Transcriptional regulator, AraC family [Cystobacter fuscus DSM 2262]|uniref:Transcriptional regulator, AraC family n=1 Tax=Cystobacter fuscus (strain ATCC 25194 / DSM 2262 / NBRC 100088 / M29) TaxID=1242864 RepID=S9QJR7_CYSF2|nr:Transcriptional regulator, AraC family [Cystobacter fuscus DSM 2262]